MFTFTPSAAVSMTTYVASEVGSTAVFKPQPAAYDGCSRYTGRWFILKRNDNSFDDSNVLRAIGSDMSREHFNRTLSNVNSGESCLGGSCSSSGIADIHNHYGYVESNNLWFMKSLATSGHAHVGCAVSERSKRLCASCSTSYAEADSSISPAEHVEKTNLPTAISIVFWKMALTFNSFSAGDLSSSRPLITFSSLWSSAEQLGGLLPEFCLNLSGSIEVLCRTAIYGQVQQLLVALIEYNIVGVNQPIDENVTLLQMACLAQNVKAVQYLISSGADVSFHDPLGYSTLRMNVYTKLLELLINQTSENSVATSSVVDKQTLTIHDKQTVFNLAIPSSESFKLLMKLQTIDFDVNRETDGSGDYLVHVLAKTGLVQLPLLLLLVKQFKASIDVYNIDGFTCLMLAASLGDCMLVDALICVLGAAVDTKNPLNGWSALHYACYERHSNVVEVLLKRGANFDVENSQGIRPDELATICRSIDCSRLLTKARISHLQALKTLIQQDKLVSSRLLRQSDLFAVDEDGVTLLMMAAMVGSLRSLTFLLNQKDAPVNAQHNKSLRTALVFAAAGGRSDAVRLLLQNNASPSIEDVENKLAIHYAVHQNDVKTIQTFLQFSTALTGLQAAIKLSTNEEVQVLLKAGMGRRQREIVTPSLFELVVRRDVNGIYCLLEDGDDVNPKNDVGDWPLYIAVQNNDYNTVKLLHQWKGDIISQHTNDCGNTVLHVCCRGGNLRLAEFLLNAYAGRDAEIRKIYSDSVVNLMNVAGFTPLMLAANEGHINLVQLLLRHGASTSVLCPTGEVYCCNGFISIQQVLLNQQSEHARLIFEAISDKRRAGLKKLKSIFVPKHDHNLRDPQTGDSPLMRACFFGRVDVIKFLLDSVMYPLINFNNPCDLPLTNGENYASNLTGKNNALVSTFSLSLEVSVPPLDDDDACYHSNITALVESMHSVCLCNPVLNGNQVNHIYATNSNDGSTAYHRAVENGDNVSVVDCLLSTDNSAVNERNAMGLGPLHLACKLNRLRTAKKLISLPFVDLNCRTLDGLLPEDLTTNKSLIKTISQARSELGTNGALPSSSVAVSRRSSFSSIGETSVVDFDKINDRFKSLKQQQNNYFLSAGVAMFH